MKSCNDAQKKENKERQALDALFTVCYESADPAVSIGNGSGEREGGGGVSSRPVCSKMASLCVLDNQIA